LDGQITTCRCAQDKLQHRGSTDTQWR